MKTQQIRLLDVYALGPAMILVGLAARPTYPVMGPVVAVAGIATIIYNAQNYQQVRRARRRRRSSQTAETP